MSSYNNRTGQFSLDHKNAGFDSIGSISSGVLKMQIFEINCCLQTCNSKISGKMLLSVHKGTVQHVTQDHTSQPACTGRTTSTCPWLRTKGGLPAKSMTHPIEKMYICEFCAKNIQFKNLPHKLELCTGPLLFFVSISLRSIGHGGNFVQESSVLAEPLVGVPLAIRSAAASNLVSSSLHRRDLTRKETLDS